VVPFQTESFNPGDQARLTQIQNQGERLTGLLLGATVYLVDGERWVIIGSGGLRDAPTWLAYPLPGAFGEDPVEAAWAFRKVWDVKAEEIRRLQPAEIQPAEAFPTPNQKNKKPAKPRRPLPLGTPLPGLEEWVGDLWRIR